MAACTLETSNNGDLDGFWQLKAVDTLATGGTADMRESGLTWSFQGRILELRDTKTVYTDILLSFQHADGHLLLSSPYIIDRESGDTPLYDAKLLRPYGIHHITEDFQVVELKSSSMVLQSDQLRLYFRKY